MALKTFFDRVDGRDWRNAVIGGAVVGLVPLVGSAISMLGNDWPILDTPLEACVGGFMLLVIGAMFGATGAVITLFFSVFIRQWPRATSQLVNEYESFARQVGGGAFPFCGADFAVFCGSKGIRVFGFNFHTHRLRAPCPISEAV